MKRLIILFLLLLLAALAALLTALNTEPVSFDYYLAQAQLPLAVMLLLSFVAGTVLTLLSCLAWLWHAHWQSRQLRKQLATTQQEIRNLRDIPIKDHY